MSSHYYNPISKELVFGLREARKVNALPSPTTILNLITSPALVEYFRRQTFEATATTPRKAGWTDDEYYEAVTHWADEHSKTARDRGGNLHDLIQSFHLSVVHEGPPPIVPPELSEQFDLYVAWYEENVERCLAVEKVVIGDGYAGRVDQIARLKDGRTVCVDTKTQDLKKRNTFNHYAKWGLQLGAYAGAWLRENPMQQVDALVSVCISSNGIPVLEAHQWERPWHYYHRLFMGLLAIWSLENNYWPLQQAAEDKPEWRSEDDETPASWEPRLKL